MNWLATGAAFCAVSVLAGAFGAHGLKASLSAEQLELWETAARYLMYAGLGLGLVEVAAQLGGGWGVDAAGRCLIAGALVFSGTVAILALGGPRWLGGVTPLGGLLLIAGFVLLAVSALRS